MDYQNSNDTIYDTAIRLLLLLSIVAGCLMIMYPFASIILWSLILAIAMYPLHSSLAKKFGGKPKLASFVIIFSILALVIVPAIFMLGSLFNEVKELKVIYDKSALSIPPPTEKVKEWPIIGEQFYSAWQTASTDVGKIIIKYKDQLLEIGIKIGRNILSAAGSVVQIIISLVIAGILLAIGGTGEAIRKFFRKVAGNNGDEFADLTVKTISSVVKGVIGEALVIALLHGAVFFLAGVPYAGIWTLAVFVIALVQLPVYLVTVPMMVYFFSVKETLPAVLWSVSVLLVSLSDNFLTPMMLGKRAPVPTVVIFVGAIGGMIVSGFSGLFTGAIVMSVGYKLFVGWINSNGSEVSA